jgi:hypothetical protein
MMMLMNAHHLMHGQDHSKKKMQIRTTTIFFRSKNTAFLLLPSLQVPNFLGNPPPTLQTQSNDMIDYDVFDYRRMTTGSVPKEEVR